MGDAGPRGIEPDGRATDAVTTGAASRLDIFARYHRSTGAALARLAAEGALPPDLDLGRFTAAPAPEGAGCDIVVDAALVYARAAAAHGRRPLDVAGAIAADLAQVPASASVAVAGPGFVNVTLRQAAVMEAVASILRAAAPNGERSAREPSDQTDPGDEPSLDEVRAVVVAEQVAALSAAAGRQTPRGALRSVPGRVVVRGRAATHRGALGADPWILPRNLAQAHEEAKQDRAGLLTRSCSTGGRAEAFRLAVASCRTGAILHLDAAALTERSRDNPAFWIPYAHARFRGVLRRAAVAMPDLDLTPPALAEADLSGLTDPGEAGLARLLVSYPHAIATAAAAASTHRFAAYLRDVATAVHSQWNRSKDQPQLRFVNEEERVSTTARLALVTASTLVLKSGLGLLGVAAPDEMC